DGRRRRVGADQDRTWGTVAGRRAAVEATADPAQACVLALVEPGRLPDLSTAEVRTVRVRISDAWHDRQPARFQQLSSVSHRRVQANLAVELDQSLLGQADGFAVFGIRSWSKITLTSCCVLLMMP